MIQIKFLQLSLWFLQFSSYIIDGTPDVVEFSSEEILKRNNLIATLATLEKTFTITFKLKSNSYTNYVQTNVIHLTNGENVGKYGERTPGVYFLDGSGKLTFFSAVNGNANYYISSEPLPLNQWSNIKISQTDENGIYTFKVYINGQIIHSIENTKPESFQNVKVYTSNPWYDAHDGSIKDLIILNGVFEAEIEIFSFYRDVMNQVTMSMSDIIKIPITVIFGVDALVTYIDPSHEAYNADTCIFTCLQNAKCYSLSFSEIGNICLLYNLNTRTNQNYFSSNINWDTYVI